MHANRVKKDLGTLQTGGLALAMSALPTFLAHVGGCRGRGLHVTCGVLARSHRSATFHQYWPWHVSQTFVAAWLNPARSTLIAQNAVGCYGRLSL